MHKVRTAFTERNIEGLPDNCPFCHNTITPNILFGHVNVNSNQLEVMFYCPNKGCAQSFLGYYTHSGGSIYKFDGNTTQGNLIGKEFKNVIINISSEFVIIYNQAFSAEQQNLLEICGVGYRKALEFLIKDYIILSKPDLKDEVEKKMVGKCIEEYVQDDRIKKVAKRANWLGNDETHYVRKWEGKNLEDLKKLIDLTVHWIEMEVLSNSFEAEMPE